jgi:hypothetical protein
LYFANSVSGADLKLASVNDNNTVIDIMSSGSGTIQIYDGHSSTTTGTINTFEDATSDPCWTTASGHGYVILSDVDRNTADLQRLNLLDISSGSVTLSANIDSAQAPGARIYLASRNISIRSSTGNSSYAFISYTTSASHGGIYQCELRAPKLQLYAISNGVGHTISGVIAGFEVGLNITNNTTISGLILDCSFAMYGPTTGTVIFNGECWSCGGFSSNFNGFLEINGIIGNCTTLTANNDKGVILSDTSIVRACLTGIRGRNITSYATVFDCSTAYSCSYSTIYGTVYNCTTCFGNCNNNEVYSNVSYVTNGTHTDTGSNHHGTFSHSTYGLYAAKQVNAYDVIFSDNYADIRMDLGSNLYGGNVFGDGASLNSTTQVFSLLYKDSLYKESRYGVQIQNLGGVTGSFGYWTQGGYCKSATYASGTHGSPTGTIPYNLIHEMTFQDNGRFCFVEIPVWVAAGKTITANFGGKLTSAGFFTTLPSIGIYDPTIEFQTSGEVLASSTMVSNTLWQYLTVSYTSLVDKELFIRVQGKGGNTAGTGAEQLYWLYSIPDTSTIKRIMMRKA